MFLRRAAAALVTGLIASLAACAPSDDASDSTDADLTSVTARSRTLTFDGIVFVDPTATEAMILDTVRRQAQTAFGPIRIAEAAVRSRELREIDTSTFVKRPVKVVDTKTGSSKPMVEVKYTYKDDAIVSTWYARRSTVPIAVMSPDYRSYVDRVLKECTTNDAEAREFMSQIWYEFDPTLDQCGKAIRKEQEQIVADRKKLADPKTEVAASEAKRLYMPITAQLGADKTNKGKSYPDYHRLYSGGVEKDKLVVGMVFGYIDDKADDPSADTGWKELMDALDLLLTAQGDFDVVDAPDRANLRRFELPSGRVLESPKFSELVRARRKTSTLGLSAKDATALERLFAFRINRNWFTIEKPIKVSVGGEQPRDFKIKINVYYGANMSSTPHKYAMKNSDVFIYNGHSMIGYGPLDPSNFTKADFPSSYQLFWMDGCVSYNYYNKDYIPLKEGGTQNLDLITNGLEADAFSSGEANGKFLVSLLGGAKASYKDLLSAAEATDALRVVDGELDNEYEPASAKTRVTITNP